MPSCSATSAQIANAGAGLRARQHAFSLCMRAASGYPTRLPHVCGRMAFAEEREALLPLATSETVWDQEKGDERTWRLHRVLLLHFEYHKRDVCVIAASRVPTVAPGL